MLWLYHVQQRIYSQTHSHSQYSHTYVLLLCARNFDISIRSKSKDRQLAPSTNWSRHDSLSCYKWKQNEILINETHPAHWLLRMPPDREQQYSYSSRFVRIDAVSVNRFRLMANYRASNAQFHSEIQFDLRTREFGIFRIRLCIYGLHVSVLLYSWKWMCGLEHLLCSGLEWIFDQRHFSVFLLSSE